MRGQEEGSERMRRGKRERENVRGQEGEKM